MKTIKCIVWDLDDTIWEGVLLEDEEVKLKSNIFEIITELDRRGVLQSIASKNSLERSMSKLEEFGIAEYFLYPQIGWSSKSESVKCIANELNIAIDTFLFIDDQNFELEEVKFHCPKISILNAADITGLLSRPDILSNLPSSEAGKRRMLYAAEKNRKEFQGSFSGTNEDFLKTLNLKFFIKKATYEDLVRAEELTLRTNQLNTTGRTFSFSQLSEYLRDENFELLIAGLEDRYGDYGKIGLALIEKNNDTWNILLFLMSCRVISRGVGSVFLNHIINKSLIDKKRLTADFYKNDVNEMMYITYKMSGFNEIDVNDPSSLEYANSKKKIIPAYVELITDL